MRLHQLCILLVVVQYGSIREVSRGLHISQPALSRTIAELERELGATLLSRSVRGVSPTAYGVALVKWASVVEQELRHALEDIKAIRSHAETEPNIGFAVVTSSGPLPDAMAVSRTRFPNVASRGFEQHSQQILEGLREDRTDLRLVSTNSGFGTSGSQWEPLLSAPMRLTARPGHPLRHMRKLCSLLDADWLVLDPLDDPGSPMVSLIRLHRLEIPYRIMQSGSNLFSPQLAIKTNLVSMWPDFVFTNMLGPLRTIPDTLEVLPMEDELPNFSVYMVYRSADLMTRVCAEFNKKIRHAA